MKNMIVWGHRGAGLREVENTLTSFRKAVEMGVDGIKTEAQLSKDGEIILQFLPFLIINNNKLSIKDLNLEEIKQVKLENGDEIPTLREMFEEFKNTIVYCFDIKEVETGIKIIDLAKEYDLLEKIEITKPATHKGSIDSFFKPLREKSREVTLVNSFFNDKQIMENNYSVLKKLKELNVQVVNLLHHRFNLEVFEQVKKAGFKFYLWAVLFKYFMKKYINLSYDGYKIDGIFTNFPDKLVNLRTEVQYL